MRRLFRKGFLQNEVYSRLGYYPWECPFCKESQLIKKRDQHRKHRVEAPAAV
jgi:hypothetical protein